MGGGHEVWLTLQTTPHHTHTHKMSTPGSGESKTLEKSTTPRDAKGNKFIRIPSNCTADEAVHALRKIYLRRAREVLGVEPTPESALKAIETAGVFSGVAGVVRITSVDSPLLTPDVVGHVNVAIQAKKFVLCVSMLPFRDVEETVTFAESCLSYFDGCTVQVFRYKPISCERICVLVVSCKPMAPTCKSESDEV